MTKHVMLNETDLQRWLLLWRMQMNLLISTPFHVRLRLETPIAWAVGDSIGPTPSAFAAFDNALGLYLGAIARLPREKRWPKHLQHELV